MEDDFSRPSSISICFQRLILNQGLTNVSNLCQILVLEFDKAPDDELLFIACNTTNFAMLTHLFIIKNIQWLIIMTVQHIIFYLHQLKPYINMTSIITSLMAKKVLSCPVQLPLKSFIYVILIQHEFCRILWLSNLMFGLRFGSLQTMLLLLIFFYVPIQNACLPT